MMGKSKLYCASTYREAHKFDIRLKNVNFGTLPTHLPKKPFQSGEHIKYYLMS